MTLKIYLQAGLGNQLFMIFTTISYAIDHGINYSILSYYDNTLNGTKTYWNTFLDCLADKVEKNIIRNEKNIYLEPVFEYNELPHELALSDNIIKGFFQSYKYFEHNYEKILNIIDFNNKIDNVKNKYNNLFTKKTIALHFRIGDYIGLQNYHCIKSPEYYINAIKKFEIDLKNRNENINDYNILYFCQKHDILCVDQMINIIKKITNIKCNFIKISDNIEDWEQMLIMSLCNHFIIANSTFSWFGAYFSNDSNKLVYYPKIWFGPALINTHNIKDLCPSSWHGL
jgi:hypothetical protein